MILPLLWVLASLAGYVYALHQDIPVAIALRVLPAVLLEVTFYYALGSERVRAGIEKLPRPMIALALTIGAMAPYSEASWAAGSFRISNLLAIGGLAALAAFWYVVLPHRTATDLLFLLLMAAVVLLHGFRPLYANPVPKLQLEALGQAMWVRTGAFAMLSIRRVQGVGFGFWPTAKDWRIGAIFYLFFMLIAIEPALIIHFTRPRVPTGWEKTTLLAVATFFGALWVLALGEEFFFRGLLQQWMSGWLGSEKGGLLVTSVLFGAAHLWFRSFPNWKLAVLAAIAGVCYGMAFLKARSIRASMVTHALVVTTWRIFFP